MPMLYGEVEESDSDAFVKMIVTSDYESEGFFQCYYFNSSYNAAKAFVESYSDDYHCSIILIPQKYREYVPSADS